MTRFTDRGFDDPVSGSIELMEQNWLGGLSVYDTRLKHSLSHKGWFYLQDWLKASVEDIQTNHPHVYAGIVADLQITEAECIFEIIKSIGEKHA